MKQPKNIHDALRHLHNLTMCIAQEAGHLSEATTVNPNHLASIKEAALDAHLLVTWIKDNFKGMKK